MTLFSDTLCALLLLQNKTMSSTLMIVVTPCPSPKEPEFVQDSCGSFVKPQQKFWLSPLPTPREEDWSLEDEIEYENSIIVSEDEYDEIDYQIWKAEQWSDF